jgi:hypothetical protein
MLNAQLDRGSLRIWCPLFAHHKTGHSTLRNRIYVDAFEFRKWVSYLLPSSPSSMFQTLQYAVLKHTLPLPTRVLSLPPLSVANPPINLPQIHTIQLPLRNLPHHPRRPPRHNTKTRNHHVRRHHTPIQYPHIILNDRELSNHDIRSDIDVRADERGFDDGGRANEDVVCDFERIVGELASSTSVSTPPFTFVSVLNGIVGRRRGGRRTPCIVSLEVSTHTRD